MKTIFHFIASFLLLFSFNLVQAQDAHFSQNHATPLFLNPAMTGLMSGDIRVAAVYRNQWSAIMGNAPFRTIIGSADIAFDGLRSQDRAAAGLMIYNDKAGDLNWQTNYADISLAYNMGLSNTSYFSIGIAGGITQRSYNLADAQFESQFNGDIFDPTMASGETLNGEGSLQANLGAGIMFYNMVGPRTNFYAGGGMFHFTRPDLAFTGIINDELQSKITAQLGGSIPIAGKIDLVPSIYYIRQGAHNQLYGGSFVRFIFDYNERNNTDKAFNLGSWVRLATDIDSAMEANALVIATKVDYNELAVGLSYDITLGDLSSVNANRGGVEISVVYTAKGKEKSQGLECPRF